jgi:hypothetical protein
MIKKMLLLVFIQITISFSFIAKADEGMWLPLLIDRLNYVDMQKMGLHLTAEEIYSVNQSSLKDAIVQLNGGSCSAEMISAEGLMMTNHHCGFAAIQSHSTVDKDYLQNGFWALNRNEELKNDKFTATFLVRIEDVTQKILSQLTPEMTEVDRQAKVDELNAKIESEATQGTFYTAQVKSFFQGNEYYLFVYETYKDVRLVGAPPEAIGKFGADADNWMWPRQTCDFCLFRIYMSPTGEPAEYSKKNIPYKPKKFLPISLKGVKKDDFTMIMGYPGTTDRFMTSFGVKLALEQTNPSIVKIREKKLDIFKEDMAASEEVKIQYASKYAISSNYYKYYIGQSQILDKLKVYDKKKESEDSFTKWVNADKTRLAKYGNTLTDISKAYEELKKYNLSVIYFKEAILRGAEIVVYANTFEELYKELKLAVDEEKISLLTQSLSYAAKQYFKNYNLATDKKIFISLITMFFDNVPKDQHPDVFENVITKKYKGDISAFANDMFEKSIFATKDKVLEFLMKPDYKKIDKDLAWITQISFYTKYKEMLDKFNLAKLSLDHANRIFIEGIMEMQKDKKFYPDANSTMRLTYGKVTDYAPSPPTAVYPYFSTIDEMMAKEQPNNPDFQVPDKIKELYRNRDFGKYAENGTMRIDFITNNDVTGGNSGAPVINADGELVGLQFDINWEATSVPIAFNPTLQRSINTDIRYVLFIIDKFAGAQQIINELTIVK